MSFRGVRETWPARTPREPLVEQLRPVLDFKDEKIETLVVKHYGKIGQATAGEKVARISWLRVELGKGPGDPHKGKTSKKCGHPASASGYAMESIDTIQE